MAGKHSMDDNEVPKAFRKTEVNNNTEEFYNGGKRERNMEKPKRKRDIYLEI